MTASLRDRLKQRRATWTDTEDALPIPGYGDELWARYKDTEWSSFRAVIGNAALNAIGTTVPLAKELQAAVKMLLEANTGLEAHVDGQVAEVTDDAGAPVRLGLGLARFLGVDLADVDTDEQAMYLIFHREKDIMAHAMQLVSVQENRAEQAGEEIRGNSEAAS